MLVTSDGGLTVTKHATPCPAAREPFPLVTSVAVEAPHGLALLCTGQGYTGHTDKTVYVSGDLGATWTLAGHPGSAGDGGMIAAPAPGHLTIATTSAAQLAVLLRRQRQDLADGGHLPRRRRGLERPGVHHHS